MSSPVSALGNLLFGQTRGGVLALLYGHSGQTFYMRQISREIGASVGAVQRELETLSNIGLIERSDSGHQVYFHANRAHPVFTELKALVAKTVGVFHQLSSALTPLAQRISLAFVYGSMARQDEKASSDVDLMVVGDVTLDEVLAQLAPVERAIGRSINPALYSVNEFKAKLQSGNHFLRSVLRSETVPLIGEINELGKVGGVRMAQS
jgi:predicted nucleotidyltransferase